MASIVAVIAAAAFGAFIAIGYASDRWKDYKFAKAHECFNPSTGKANPASGSYPWCADGERLQEHVTFDTKPVKPIEPLVTGYEFPFRRIGSEDYLKAICYDETTGKATQPSSNGDLSFCKAGSILMVEATR